MDGKTVHLFLKIDCNFDTTAEAVQKAVRIVTLIFLSSVLLFAFLFGTFGAAATSISALNSRPPLMSLTAFPPYFFAAVWQYI